MDLSIKNTTKEQRLDIVKNALAISITGSDVPDEKVLRIAKEYVDGQTEISDVQAKIINMYKKGGEN
jgi:hypothetical protein